MISSDTPLISNLSIQENIALIKEVHEKMSINSAENLARRYLEKLKLEHIASYRFNQCTPQQIFYTMFLRAMMTKEKQIIVVTPFSLINNLRDITILTDDISKLECDKEILILDTYINENHYKGCSCRIIK